MYHYVRDRLDGMEAGIRGLSQSAFESQLDALCEKLTPIDWPTFANWRAGAGNIPERSFLLTFDDALSDHAEVVFPILEERGLRGVFFVHTNVLTEARMETAHQIHLLMCKLDIDGLATAVERWIGRNGAGIPFDLDANPIDAQRVYHYESPERATLKYWLSCVVPLDVRARIVDDLFADHVGDARAYASKWYLSWDDLSMMQRGGHAIGGHGHSHLPYARVTAADRERDMRRCASVLAEGLGIERRPFSYPFGNGDESIARSCADAGFVNGFTTREDWIDASGDDHRLNRVDAIHVESLLEREFLCSQV